MPKKSISVLETKINIVTPKEVPNEVKGFLHSITSHTVYTPNPEMLVAAYRDVEFQNILNESSLNICDGKGIEFLSKGRVKRIAGVDMMMDICKLAEEERKSVYLLGSGSDEVIEKTKTNLINKFPKLKIVGYNKGLAINNQQPARPAGGLTINYSKEENDKILDDIIMKAPDILFVAFGHVKQEKWIHENLKHLPSIRIAMGVGGSFDYISGSVARAPKFIRNMGLEWLYRLIRQPWRVKRIWNAVIVFPYLYFKNK